MASTDLKYAVLGGVVLAGLTGAAARGESIASALVRLREWVAPVEEEPVESEQTEAPNNKAGSAVVPVLLRQGGRLLELRVGRVVWSAESAAGPGALWLLFAGGAVANAAAGGCLAADIRGFGTFSTLGCVPFDEAPLWTRVEQGLRSESTSLTLHCAVEERPLAGALVFFDSEVATDGRPGDRQHP